MTRSIRRPTVACAVRIVGAVRAAATSAVALIAAALLAAAPPAHAGRRCEPRPPAAEAVAAGMELALRTARALDASGAQVVVLARAGQDLSRWGLEWSHLGLAYRDGERWLVAHKLNACGSDRADLWRQGLAQFFLDDPHRHEAAWTVPTPAVQQALLQALRDPTRLVAMHEPRYSVVAYPWSSRYQQSNQWVVETLAAALEGRVADRAQAQARLAALGWRPPELRIDAMERVGAQLGNASIAFDDHPPTRRLAGRIATTSADAALRWLQDSGLAGPLQRLGP